MAVVIDEACGVAARDAAVIRDLKDLVIWPQEGRFARIAIGGLLLPAGGGGSKMR